MVLDLSLAVVSGMGSQWTHVKFSSALHKSLSFSADEYIKSVEYFQEESANERE